MTESQTVALVPDTLDVLRGVSTATLTMQLLKRGLRNIFIAGVRPLKPGGPRLVGEAYTLRLIPMREDLSRPEVLGNPEYPPRKAIEEVPAGHVLVIDCRGVTDAGSAGDILITRLQRRGVAGLVTDGAMRDADGVAALGFPVFCAGAAAPPGLNRHFGVDLQRPIACGGTAVFPGDVIVGDGDGVVVIPRHLADEVARGGAEQELLEAFIQKKVAEGRHLVGTYPPDAATLAEYEAWKASHGTVSA